MNSMTSKIQLTLLIITLLVASLTAFAKGIPGHQVGFRCIQPVMDTAYKERCSNHCSQRPTNLGLNQIVVDYINAQPHEILGGQQPGVVY